MFSSSDVSLSRVGPFLRGKFKPSSLIIFGNLAMFPHCRLWGQGGTTGNPGSFLSFNYLFSKYLLSLCWALGIQQQRKQIVSDVAELIV